MKKHRMSVIVWLVLMVSVLAVSLICQAKDGSVLIGVTQIVEHPALDAAREGFIEALIAEGFIVGENLELEIRSAQGDITTASMIAEEFVRKKKDLILAIATPTAQAALNATQEIPILITAVTDPVVSGLAATLASSKNNVTGTTDMTPIEEQFTLIQTLLPTTKRVGVLYNGSEVNSLVQVEQIKAACKKREWKLVETTITNVTEIQIGAEQLVKKVDVLYVPTDNLVASAMPVVVAVANKAGIPIIGADEAIVEAGALATLGIDYKKLGYQTGLMAAQVLRGTKPADLPIQGLKDLTLVINQTSADHLQIAIPAELQARAVFIEGGE